MLKVVHPVLDEWLDMWPKMVVPVVISYLHVHMVWILVVV